MIKGAIQFDPKTLTNWNRLVMQTADAMKKTVNDVTWFAGRAALKAGHSRTKLGKKQSAPRAWWDDAEHPYAVLVDVGRRRSIWFESRQRKQHLHGGRGFAKATWAPLFQRMGMRRHASIDDWRSAEQAIGRVVLRKPSRSAIQWGRFTSFRQMKHPYKPSVTLANWAPPIIAMEHGVPGMAPRHIGRAMIDAARRNVDGNLRRALERQRAKWR